jgi:putative transposase
VPQAGGLLMVIRKRLNILQQGMAFVTTTTNSWIPVFNIQQAAEATLKELAKTLDLFEGSLIGYVLMPTHIHMLVCLPKISSLSKFVQTFKSISSRRVKEIDLNYYRDSLIKNGKFRLWKPRFDDFIIRTEDQFRVKIEYIHNNPVRAGLVGKATDWLYSSAVDWIEGKTGILWIDKSLFDG